HGFLDFQCCGLVPPADSHADEVGPPDPLSLLASPRAIACRRKPGRDRCFACFEPAGNLLKSPANHRSPSRSPTGSRRWRELNADSAGSRRPGRPPDRLAAIAELLVERYPSDHIASLALAEAHEQEAKN